MSEATQQGYKDQADRIRRVGSDLDYETMAIEALARSWELDDRECQACALADAQVWATLHLARVLTPTRVVVSRAERGGTE